MFAVIDTNCLLASVPRQSIHYWLYLAFEQEKFNWLISNEILSEYEEKLINKYSENTAAIVFNILSVAPNVIYREPYFKWTLLKRILTTINLRISPLPEMRITSLRT